MSEQDESELEEKPVEKKQDFIVQPCGFCLSNFCHMCPRLISRSVNGSGYIMCPCVSSGHDDEVHDAAVAAKSAATTKVKSKK